MTRISMVLKDQVTLDYAGSQVCTQLIAIHFVAPTNTLSSQLASLNFSAWTSLKLSKIPLPNKMCHS